ncbi:hypothetical protein FQN57_002593 [Myotisia sp. PD_48]|nr:hypothetical protein FQN57_002593 [Myotisia sp. PD_48]
MKGATLNQKLILGQSMHAAPLDGIQVPYQYFCLVGINGSGKPEIHTPEPLDKFKGQIFTQEFQNWYTQRVGVDITDKPSHSEGPKLHNRGAKLVNNDLNAAYPSHLSKKRRLDDVYMGIAAPAHKKEDLGRVSLRIDDEKEVNRFYKKSFEAFQQKNCRQIAKAYIKMIEPRKQVKHPYNGRWGGPGEKGDPEKTKPNWWPAGVVHREPDHLKKPERIRLLIHIFRKLLESHDITADKLEEAGQDTLRQIKPRERLGIMDEIYRVRRIEESYERGEIDGATVISVTSWDANHKVECDSENDSSTYSWNTESRSRVLNTPNMQEKDSVSSPVNLSRTLVSDRSATSPFCRPSNESDYRLDAKTAPDKTPIDNFPRCAFVSSSFDEQITLRNPHGPPFQTPFYGNLAYGNNSQVLSPQILSTQSIENHGLGIQQQVNSFTLPESPHPSRSQQPLPLGYTEVPCCGFCSSHVRRSGP